eukprot:Em0081g3a
MSNAFNMASRQAVLDESETFFTELLLWVPWCYGSHTICCGTLWVRIFLSQEYSKGDPLGPVLFALVSLKLVTTIDAVDLLVDTWYLEDGVLVGDRSAVSKLYTSVTSWVYTSNSTSTFQSVNYSVEKWQFTNSTNDILVQDWDRGMPAAFDVTVTSSLTPVTLNVASVSVGTAAEAAEIRKHAANDSRCQDLGSTCVPQTIETYGNWDKEAHGVFSHLASLLSISQSIPKPKIVTEIYSHLNMSLVRSVARTLKCPLHIASYALRIGLFIRKEEANEILP